MRIPALLFAIGTALAAQDTQPAQGPEGQGAADVDRLYAREFIGWSERVAGLESEEPLSAGRDARYLVALLKRLHDDQVGGRSPARLTGAWGSGSENVAREARQDIVEYLVSKEITEGRLIPLRWIVENDSNVPIVRIATEAIVGCPLPGSTKILADCVNEGRGGATTIARFLEELGKRGVAPAPAALEKHLRSHRRVVRDAAAPLAAKAGVPIPPAPDGAAWFETEGGAALMRRLAALVGPSLPAGTAFVEVEPTGKSDEPSEAFHDRGWLLEEKDGFIRIETPNGYVKTIRLAAPPGRKSPEHRYRVVEPATEVERVAALRAAIDQPDPESRSETESRPEADEPTVIIRREGDPPDRFDLRGELSDCEVLSAQFEPMAYSLYEVLLGFRLWQMGQADLAARVLPHVVEATPNDDDFLYFVEWFLGDAIGHRMIAQFCKHDLAAAETTANRIVTRFPRSQFVKVARRLRDEIPRRRDDWKGFRLPTEAEWTEIAAGLDRDGQIRYLCERARLVTAIGPGQVAAWPTEKQYAQPRPVNHRVTGHLFELAWDALSGDADLAIEWVLGGRLPFGEVINPLRVLRDGPLSPRQLGQPPSGVGTEDIPLLRARMQPEWLAGYVNSWRFFHSGRSVGTTTDLIEFLIQEIERR